MSHHERERLPLDHQQPVKMILPESCGVFSSPIDPDVDRELNNAWIAAALNRSAGQMGHLHRTIIRNQWWLIATIAVNTVLVLILAALAWVSRV